MSGLCYLRLLLLDRLSFTRKKSENFGSLSKNVGKMAGFGPVVTI